MSEQPLTLKKSPNLLDIGVIIYFYYYKINGIFYINSITEINLIRFDDTETYLQFIRDNQKLFEFHWVITIIKISAGRSENTTTEIL